MSSEMPLDLIFDSDQIAYTAEEAVNKIKSAIKRDNRIRIEGYGADPLNGWYVGAHLVKDCPLLLCRIDEIRAVRVALNQKGIKIYKEK
jgi:hypothetical protein